MTTVSKDVYINNLDDIVNKYNNTYHGTTKMKPLGVKDNINIDFNKKVHDKDPKFKVDGQVRTSKYKNSFVKGYTNWSEEVFVIKKVGSSVPWTAVYRDLNDEEIIQTFYEKELQKTNQEEFRTEKVMKNKGNKLLIKWNIYDISFNSWIDKKDIRKSIYKK